MKNGKLIRVVLALGALAISAGSALAEPCGAVLCLSTNSMAPWECKGHVDGYFDIRVYRSQKRGGRIFDPGATSAKRYSEVMDQCPDAEQSDKDRVNAKYGMLERSPFDYTIVDSNGGSTYAPDSLETITEERFITCTDAAQRAEYAGSLPSPQQGVFDGTPVFKDGYQVGVIQNGYAERMLKAGDLWAGTAPVYGYAIEARKIKKTTGSGTVVETGEWIATKKQDCGFTWLDIYGSSQGGS